MALHAKVNNTPAAANAVSTVPQIETFATSNGDLNIPLNRAQWMNIVGALSIAAGQAATERHYEQMFEYSGVCVFLGQRLGVTQQTALSGDTSPPLARTASA